MIESTDCFIERKLNKNVAEYKLKMLTEAAEYSISFLQGSKSDNKKVICRQHT